MAVDVRSLARGAHLEREAIGAVEAQAGEDRTLADGQKRHFSAEERVPGRDPQNRGELIVGIDRADLLLDGDGFDTAFACDRREEGTLFCVLARDPRTAPTGNVAHVVCGRLTVRVANAANKKNLTPFLDVQERGDLGIGGRVTEGKDPREGIEVRQKPVLHEALYAIQVKGDARLPDDERPAPGDPLHQTLAGQVSERVADGHPADAEPLHERGVREPATFGAAGLDLGEQSGLDLLVQGGRPAPIDRFGL